MNDFLLLNQNISANVTIIKFELVWEEKYVTIICWRYRKIKIQTTFSKVSVRHETCLLKFFSEQCSNALKDFLVSLSPTFSYSLTPYIKLPSYVRTSYWSAKSILMSVRHGFMNFIQIGSTKQIPMLEVSLAILLVISKNKKRDWATFD